MPKPLPISLIGEAMLSQNRNGQTFYYQVTFTVFGEVLSIEDDLSDLPHFAQKLMLGNQRETISNELQKGLDQLQYLIPLIALGETYGLPQWTRPIQSEIQKLQKNIPPEIKKNAQEYIETPWLKQLINLDSTSYIYNKQISKYFVDLMLEKDIIINIHQNFPIEATPPTALLISQAMNHWGRGEQYLATIKQLSKTANRHGYKTLVSIIFDSFYPIEAKISAIKAIGKMSYNNARFPLSNVLTEDNHWLRVYAVKELANFIYKKEIANTLLFIYKNDQNQWVRVRAVQALGLVQDDIELMDELAHELNQLDKEEIIFHTIEALKRMDCRYSRNLLKKYHY